MAFLFAAVIRQNGYLMIPGYSNQPPFTFLPEANQDVVISLLLLYGIKFIANTTHTDNIIWNIGGYFEPFPQPTHYVIANFAKKLH